MTEARALLVYSPRLCKVLQVGQIYLDEVHVRAKGLLAGLSALAVAVYVGAWIGWRVGWSWLATIDSTTLAVAHRIGAEHPAWAIFWNAWCTVFSPGVFRLVTVALIVYALVRRDWRVAVFLLLTVELSGPLTELAKHFADRPRPATAMVYASSTSFPSGHALGTMACVLALAVVLLPHVRRGLWPWLIAAGVVIVVSVGLGRVALNVHHLSDVVAGWALGYLYFTLCLPVLSRRAVITGGETPATPGTER